jgi:hypothetical protein
MHVMLGFECGVIGFECDVTGFECDVTGFECDVTGFECDVTGFECDVTGFECDVTGFECGVTGFECGVTIRYACPDGRPRRHRSAQRRPVRGSVGADVRQSLVLGAQIAASLIAFYDGRWYFRYLHA